MIRGLDKIKTLEEYNLAKKDLDYCVSEYKWISDAENPKKEIEDKLKACSQELKAGMDEQEEFELLARIHVLKTKYISIVRGEYKSALKRNINGLVLMLEQFEAANQEVKFSDLVKGIVTGNPETKEYMKKKYMFTLANMYGTTPAPECLTVESMDDILDYMDKNYDLVDIDLSERKEAREEVSLVPFVEPVVGIKAELLASIEHTVDDCLKGYEPDEVKAKTTQKSVAEKPHENKKRGKNKKVEKEEIEEGEIDK